ncbi:MAG TPA: hypothetical protein VMU89_03840 [Thermomicrobiaceae bacterium]|nr:hypothetical protein [Thermomicrobiaceae bacterium]
MASPSTLPLSRFLTFSRRGGWLSQLIVGVVLLLLVGGLVLNNYLGSYYSADGTAVAYVEAIGRGDAGTAWSLMSVSGSAAPTGGADLATEAGLAGQLRLEPARLGVAEVKVVSHRAVPGGAQVTVSYKANGAVTTTQLTLTEESTEKHFAVYPTWVVSILPSIVNVKSPGVPYSVDGARLPQATLAVRVLPGSHVLATRPTDLFAQFATTVDVEGGQTATANLAPKLTSAASTDVGSVVKAAITACVTNPYGGRCPGSFHSFTGQWQLVGDPTADMSVAVDADGRPTATGHYLATVRQSFGGGASDIAVGGGYSAVLEAVGSSFKVDSVDDASDLPPIPRPATPSDPTLLEAVAAAMAACQARSDPSPDDCPQSLSPGTEAVGLQWSWDSDPMAGASPSFDGQTGIYHVAGKFAATANYTESLLGTISARSGHSSGKYDAELVLDGGSPRVVMITATPS